MNFQDNTKHYGEDKSTQFFQTMQASHEDIREVAREHTEEAIKMNVSDHNKKAFPRKSKIKSIMGILLQDMRLLQLYQKFVTKICTIVQPWIDGIFRYNMMSLKRLHDILILCSVLSLVQNCLDKTE